MPTIPPTPAANAAPDAVAASTLRAHLAARLAEAGVGADAVLVAVSGGPDSMVLLHLLAELAPRRGLTLTVGHVDHGIDPRSGAVAERVRAAAARLGIPVLQRSLGLGSAANETRARTARYAALTALRREAGARWIVTAHHADDQAETVLLRVLRGSGPAGLAAMALRRGHLIRPLLDVPRAVLAAFLEERGLDAWDDPANRDPRHDRSWLRTVIMPALTARRVDTPALLGRTAALAAADRTAWDTLLDAWPDLETRAEPGGCSVAVAPLLRYDSALGSALVRALGRRAGVTIGSVRAARVLAWLPNAQSGGWVSVGGGSRATRQHDRLHVTRPAAPAAPVAPVVLEGARGEARTGEWRFRWTPESAGEPRREGASAWFAPGPLVVRAVAAGDRIRPLGGRGSRRVVRCLQDAGIPAPERQQWPVVERDGTILWVTGICRAEGACPTPGTEAMRVDVDRV